MMFDWIKRAVRWPWFGARTEAQWRHVGERVYVLLETVQNPEAVANAAREATIAQKNVRLASIARTRGKLKDEIARLKRNKKRTSHLQAELARLTRMELELESGK